jgi:hypothetical protein
MLDLAALPAFGSQRQLTDPIVYAYGSLNTDCWFVLEYDGADRVVVLIDDRAGPLRIEVLSLHMLTSQCIEMTLPDEIISIPFAWVQPFSPMPLSTLVRQCQRRIRHFPRPPDDICRPDPVKASQSAAALVAENRWLSR